MRVQDKKGGSKMSMEFREIVEVVEADPMRRRKGLEADDPSFSLSTNNNDKDTSKKSDDDFRSAVTRAVTKGNEDFFYDADGNIEEFPDIEGLTEMPNKNGMLPLAIAAQKGYSKIVDALLDLGANINGQSLKNGQTALIQAVAQGHTDIVELLLEKGADIGIRTKKGHTALDFAKNDEIKNLLLQAKAVPQISSLRETLEKNIQIVHGKEDNVSVIKDYGVPTSPPNIPDNEPDAALTVSALKNKMLR